ncbi:hypothetical protein CRYUN_Cryun09bG0010400 [Craigia yunnanensis]
MIALKAIQAKPPLPPVSMSFSIREDSHAQRIPSCVSVSPMIPSLILISSPHHQKETLVSKSCLPK